ncbi:MAG: transcription elongation factor GreA [Phototrophicaceae bacterium]
MTIRRQLTRDGYEKLEREIYKLQEADIPAITERLRAIREDNVGNEEDSELHDTMEMKKRLEERLSSLLEILNKAEIIDSNDPNVINIGDRVVLFDVEYDEEMSLDLVDGIEISGDRRAITVDSPVGQALIGKKVDDIVKVKVPDGVAKYKVLSFAPID